MDRVQGLVGSGSHQRDGHDRPHGMAAGVDVAILPLIAINRPLDQLVHPSGVLIEIVAMGHGRFTHTQERGARVARQLGQRLVDAHKAACAPGVASTRAIPIGASSNALRNASASFGSSGRGPASDVVDRIERPLLTLRSPGAPARTSPAVPSPRRSASGGRCAAHPTARSSGRRAETRSRRGRTAGCSWGSAR